MKKNEKKLLKMRSLLETSKLLNSEQDISTILDTLLVKSLELTKGGDMGVIFLHNEETDFLEICAYKGMGESVEDVKLLPGESMTGITFKNKRPMFFSDSNSVQRAMSKMKDRNKKLAVAGNVIAEDINSSICCPLIYKKKIIGVLVVDSVSNDTTLEKEDVDFLMDISTQATIAIINARNYRNEIENNKKLKKYNKIIQNQKNKYKHSNYIHTKLTDMVLNGSSTNDIIVEIKKLIGKDIFIIDLFYNLSSNTLQSKNREKVNKKIPDLISHLKKEKNKYFDSENRIYYNIFPIMVNKETMGWLCVLSKNPDDLIELDIITTERATTIIALELFKKNEILDMEQSLKGDFLDSLLLNNDLDYINKCSKRYGFNINVNHRIITIQLTMPGNESNFNKKIKKILTKYYEIISEKSKVYFSRPISLIKGDMIVIIIEYTSQQDKKKIENFIESFEKKCRFASIPKYNKLKHKIGISETFNAIEKFKKAYFNSIQALKMINIEQMERNYVYYEELEIKRFLMNNDPDELRAYADKIFASLKTYKNSSKLDFIKTLKTYLQSNCNWTKTKNALHIHGNTLTYRLNRISKILDIELDDYNDRLRLQIAYEILDLFSSWKYVSSDFFLK